MFSKKMILSVLTISALFAGKAQAGDSDKLIGSITKTQGKDFLAGFGLGVTHGFANRVLVANYSSSLLSSRTYLNINPSMGISAINSSPTSTEIYPHFFTFIAANKLENTYNGKKYNKATLLGRGIGQCLAESIIIGQDKHNKPQVKFSMRLNLPLISAFLNWVNN